MAINTAYILAGVAAGGTSGADLAWFAPTGSTAPTEATSELDAAFKSPGLVSEDGVAQGISEDKKSIRAYGLGPDARVIVVKSEVTLKLSMLETNKYSAAVYHRLPIGGITPSGGAFSTTEGQFRHQQYAMVVDVVDGSNHIRMYAPLVEVTDRDGRDIKAGEALPFGVTLTAFPGSDGVALTTFYVVSGLT